MVVSEIISGREFIRRMEECFDLPGTEPHDILELEEEGEHCWHFMSRHGPFQWFTYRQLVDKHKCCVCNDEDTQLIDGGILSTRPRPGTKV